MGACSLRVPAGAEAPEPLDGKPFHDAALKAALVRDHATVGWGSTETVIAERWWLSCNADGTGVLLRQLASKDPFAANAAAAHPDMVRKLFTLALEDAGGAFPDWIIDLASSQPDAPGCFDLAARE